MKLGESEIFSFVENRFKIDGGAMFGIVPRVIWEKLVHCDSKNRVDLDLNLLLVKTKEKNILIDTGIGDCLTDRMKKVYGIESGSNLNKCLAMLGLKPEDIDLVILTHLHLDRAGGVVRFNEKGEKVPSFPNAKHIIQSQEWEDALSPDERTMATYFPENFLILKDFQLVELVDGEKEMEPGVKVIPTGGHTAGHQAVLIESRNERVLCPGDIIPILFDPQSPLCSQRGSLPYGDYEGQKGFSGKMSKSRLECGI